MTPQTIYLTVEEIDQRNRQREFEAASLPSTCLQHRTMMKEIVQWRSYAEAKRSIELQGPKRGA